MFRIILKLSGIFLVGAVFFSISFNAQVRPERGIEGEKAIRQLKQEGSYDSLMEAVKTARQNRGETGAAARSIYRQTGKLIGPAPDASFGSSVSLSGDTAIVGALRDDVGSNLDQGSVYVFARNGLGWTEQARLTASDGAANDNFGSSLAISGDIAIIGAANDDVGSNTDQGSVYIFTRASGTWTEQAHLTAADGAAFDRFGGTCVGISGNTALIGVALDDIGANVDQGSAYVFVSDGTNWTQQSKLSAADGAASDQFGTEVAISGDTAVAGASSDDIGANSNQGSVYVFTRSGTTWTPEIKLNASDGAAGDVFGSRVAISGETLIAGAMSDDIGSNPNQGSAYVFVRVGTVWTEQAKLLAQDGAANESFGTNVGISGDTVVIGAASDGVCSKNNQGSAYIFTRTGSVWAQQAHLTAADGFAGQQLTWDLSISGDTVIAGTARNAAYVFQLSKHNWMQEAKTVASDASANDYFGNSVSISGNTAVVGAPYDDVSFADQGSAYIFVRKGNEWIQQSQLIASDGGESEFFGSSVAINGDTVVIGAPSDDIGATTAQGSAYIFVRSGITWTEQAKLIASDGAASDLFGTGVGISGDTVIIGAFWDNVGPNTDQGSAYIFTRSGSVWTQQQKLTASDGTAGDALGFAVAVSGDTAIATAGGADAPVSNQGAAYVFVRNGTVWTEQAKLMASDGAANDRLGVAVALSGETMILTTNSDDVGSNVNQGSAYIFVRNGTAWTEQAKLIASDGRAGSGMGDSVSLSGDTAIVGAPFHGFTSGTHEGAAYIYQRKGTTWNEIQLIASDAGTGDYFSWGVGISGNTVVIGSRYAFTTTIEQGAAYMFELNHTPFDFDGDGRSDISVFRPDADDSKNFWFVYQRSDCGVAQTEWGLETDYLMPADYDGDSFADIAVWRENVSGTDAYCYIYNSSDNSIRVEQFGQDWDIMTVGDWDGDGRDDPAVYRDSAFGSQSYFFYIGSLANPSGYITYLPWGMTGDRPVRGDFDGDGKKDAAVFRPSTAIWYIRQSSNGQIRYESWGLNTDKLVPADYDGDGKTDLAVFRDGVWYIRQSSDGQIRYESFGLNTDTLVPADYDGDGIVDIAVYRSGEWYIRQSSDGEMATANWGMAGDKPVPAAYLP